MEVQALKMEELLARLGEVEGQGQEVGKVSHIWYGSHLRFSQEESPPPSPGISIEEAQQLRDTIDNLETELSDVRARLAAKEDAERRLCE